MELRTVKFGWRFYFATSLRKIQKVTGVNSKIDDETHFLMWDFDDTPITVVVDSLEFVQEAFNLPTIEIIRTRGDNYHAYCFKACDFIEARGIISFTPNVDRHFLAAGMSRGYFTLRFTEMPGQEFEHAITLRSETPSDLSYKDVNCFVEYTKAIK